MIYPESFSIIVIGGGHAGCEAARAASVMMAGGPNKKNEKKVLLLTNSIENLGTLSCNVSIGSPGKSHMMKEIDALNGLSPICVDYSATSISIINRSKGPAMQSHHAILDRQLYKNAMRERILALPNLTVFQDSVEDVVLEGSKVKGVKTQSGMVFECDAVIICAGTFLNGKIHVGMDNYTGGRAGEPATISLANRLKELNLPMGRLKTGTPARIDGRTIDYSKLTAKWGDGVFDGNMPTFSFMGDSSMHPKQLPCYLTRTNEKTHEILRSGFDRSPFILQKFDGPGPRYCPSIEDKITRFADKDSHQIILEAEGLTTHEVYPNGISTSLPLDIQIAALRSIEGLENAVLTRPGYAIEYDYFIPSSFKNSLESRDIENMFVAGQLLSSTGYSEAQATGIWAGINCALKLKGDAAWAAPQESYLSVMIEELTTKEVLEPLRMFTSRNPYRLSASEGTADQRMTPIGRKLGLIDDERWDQFCRKQDAIARLQEKYKLTWLNSKNLSTAEAVEHIGSPLSHETNLASLIKRPEMSYEKITAMPSVQAIAPELAKSTIALEHGEKLAQEIVEQVEISFKYEGYISRQQEEVKRMSAQNNIKLPIDFDYATITALSTEVKQKLNQFKPETIGQASRISGITPSAISLLLIWLKKNKMLNLQSV